MSEEPNSQSTTAAAAATTRRWQRPSTPLHAHWDLFSGAAGDMMLAACLDAAAARDQGADVLLQEIVQCLTLGLPELAGEFQIRYQQVWRSKGRIAAKHVSVDSIYQHAAAPVPETVGHEQHEEAIHQTHSHGHSHDHCHESSSHSHQETAHHDHSHSHSHPADETSATNDDDATEEQSSHDHTHSHSSSSRGPLRNLPEIRTMLEQAKEEFLPSWVKTTAIQAFTELAQAEATVHGAKSMEHVHFHEVGAVDSIVDMVGTILALYLLGITTFSCSPLPLGRGMVSTAHGILPVPAPATLYLMKDLPTTRGPPGRTGELVTPTGAALIRVLVQQHAAPSTPAGDAPSGMVLRDIGVGAGTKDFEGHANVLRLLLGELMEQPVTTKTTAGRP